VKCINYSSYWTHLFIFFFVLTQLEMGNFFFISRDYISFFGHSFGFDFIRIQNVSLTSLIATRALLIWLFSFITTTWRSIVVITTCRILLLLPATDKFTLGLLLLCLLSKLLWLLLLLLLVIWFSISSLLVLIWTSISTSITSAALIITLIVLLWIVNHITLIHHRIHVEWLLILHWIHLLHTELLWISISV